MSLIPPLDLSSLWVIVTCMGRLDFVRRSVPGVLEQFPGTYCLVDYGCPDGSGDWLAREHADRVESGRVVIERVAGVDRFHKADALNRGARRALAGGARQLCFLDADTLVLDGFWRWLEQNWDPAEFLTVALDAVRSLFGVLILSAENFELSGGYDLAFRGWGNEDLEMRLRLHLAQRLDYALIPAQLLSALPHTDELRTRHYSEKSKQKSFDDSWVYTIEKVVAWAGRPPWQLGPSVATLMNPLAPDVGESGFFLDSARAAEGGADASSVALRTERRFRRRVGRH